VAKHAAEDFVWPAQFSLEMQTCGYPNARWDLESHKLIICYELAADFADLYRDYGGVPAGGTRAADGPMRRIVGAAAYKPRKRQHKLKSSR
jgi:hypothetical protein